MSRDINSRGAPAQPSLAELMARYLHGRAEAQTSGLPSGQDGSEVWPHEAVSAQPVEPRLAWDEASAALACFQPVRDLQPGTPDWPLLVNSQESIAAVPFAAGNFPQLLRSFQPLLQTARLTNLRPQTTRPLKAAGLMEWAERAIADHQAAEVLLAAGCLRLARQFDDAATVLERLASTLPEEWQAAHANEVAALAWHGGDWEQAAQQWDGLAPSIPVLFNRGMAALFLGHPQDARRCLGEAIAQLPEASAWQHLGRLYLTLAEIRS